MLLGVSLALLLYPVGLPSLGASLARERPALAAASVGANNTTFHGNLLVPAPAPNGSAPGGSALEVAYQVKLDSAASAPGLTTVYFPTMSVTFEVGWGALPVVIPPAVVNLTTENWTASPATTRSVELQNLTYFVGDAPVALSSELLSVMSSRPYGTVSLLFEWQYRLSTPGAAEIPWSPAGGVALEPAELARLTRVAPLTLAPGGPVEACVDGPVADRTFSLHAEVASPYDDFVQRTVVIPADPTLPYCWNVTIPGTIRPGPILLHLWDFDEVTLLLDSVRLNLTNLSTPATAPGADTMSPWEWVAVGGLGGVGALLLAGQRIRSRRNGPDSSPGSDAPAELP